MEHGTSKSTDPEKKVQNEPIHNVDDGNRGEEEEEQGDKEGDDKSVEDLTRAFSLTSKQLGRDSLCKVSKLINALTKKRGVKVSKLTEVAVPGTTLAILRIGVGIVNNTLRPTIPSDCDLSGED
ncbi:hypothetical protein Tco_0374450 [Tanacetum coccineum]